MSPKSLKFREFKQGTRKLVEEKYYYKYDSLLKVLQVEVGLELKWMEAPYLAKMMILCDFGVLQYFFSSKLCRFGETVLKFLLS